MATAAKPGLIFVRTTLVGIGALFVALGLAGGGHGTYLPAKLLFPFTMLLALPDGPISFLGITIAVLQFPAYGIALAAATAAGRRSRGFAAVAAVHALAAVAAVAFSLSDIFPS